MYTLEINAPFHDSSPCLVDDGTIAGTQLKQKGVLMNDVLRLHDPWPDNGGGHALLLHIRVKCVTCLIFADD